VRVAHPRSYANHVRNAVNPERFLLEKASREHFGSGQKISLRSGRAQSRKPCRHNKTLPGVTTLTRTECMWGGRTRNTGQTLRNQQRAETSTGTRARMIEEAAMDTVPNGNVEQKFQEMLAKLTATPVWSEKQQLELEMARDISTEMLRLAEVMRDGNVDMETCLTMLKYAKVLDFVMTTLASRRDIKPQTLRVIFKLAGLKVDEAYPG
jgi:hypothetical protein